MVRVAWQDVMGVALPDDTVPFDGVSLKPVIEDPSSSVKDVALSTFPRCSHEVRTAPTKPSALHDCMRLSSLLTAWDRWNPRGNSIACC